MTTFTARVGRWKTVVRDLADAVVADEPLLCSDPSCDCETAATGIDEACLAHN